MPARFFCVNLLYLQLTALITRALGVECGVHAVVVHVAVDVAGPAAVVWAHVYAKVPEIKDPVLGPCRVAIVVKRLTLTGPSYMI